MQDFLDPRWRSVALGDASQSQAAQARSGFEALGTESGAQAFTTNGAAVKSLQRQLVFLGYATGSGASAGAVMDGQYGPGTSRAVQTFQREHGLPVGTLDRETAQKLGKAVGERAAEFTPTELQMQQKVLDSTVNRTTHLGVDYRNVVEGVARGGPNQTAIPPDLFYALMRQEAGGGAQNLPRWEASVARPLDRLHQHLNQAPLATLDPVRDQRQIGALFENAPKVSPELPGLLSSMTGPNPSTQGKLDAMRSFAAFTPGERRELATSHGYGQILGYKTLDRQWQRASGKSAGQLLTAIRSPDPTTQVEAFGSFVRHGQDAQGRTGGLARALNTKDPARIAASHNGSSWKQYNPHYADNLGQFARSYRAPLRQAASPVQSGCTCSPGLLGLVAAGQLQRARTGAYAQMRGQLLASLGSQMALAIVRPLAQSQTL